MRVFVAGASGAVGRLLLPMLIADGHEVTGMTRSPDRADALRVKGAAAVVADAYDQQALQQAMLEVRPEVVIHQLTDLAAGFSVDSLRANTRLREIGTRHLIAAAQAARARRLIVQSSAWLYAPGDGDRTEADPLRDLADEPGDPVLPGVLSLEQQVRGASGLEGVILRYGLLYGPGTAAAAPHRQPSLEVSAAARAAALAVTRGLGTYNIVDDGGGVSNRRARAELGWDPSVAG